MNAHWALTVLAAAAFAPSVLGEALTKEKLNLQGTWVIESAEGGDESPENPIGVKFSFSGDQVTVLIGDRKQEGTYTIDPTKNPKHIDFTFDDMGHKDVSKLIYQWEGDTLKLCGGESSRTLDRNGKIINQKTAARPEKFDTKDTAVVTLKREKK